MSEVAYPSSRSRFRQPARSSSRAMMPLRRLDTLQEAPSVDTLNEKTGRTERGMSRTKSSSSDSRVPAPRRHLPPSAGNDSGSEDNLRNGQHEVEQEEEQPSSPPPAWAAEPRDNAAQNPLLRRPQWNPRRMWKSPWALREQLDYHRLSLGISSSSRDFTKNWRSFHFL